MFLDQLEKAAYRAMVGIAARPALDVVAGLDELPGFSEVAQHVLHRLAIATAINFEHTAFAIEERLVRGDAVLCHPRGDHAAARGMARVKRFCHGSEVAHETAHLRGGKTPRPPQFISVKPR
ncbi:hypothetical protein D3C83_14770 [compost metagenome]